MLNIHQVCFLSGLLIVWNLQSADHLWSNSDFIVPIVISDPTVFILFMYLLLLYIFLLTILITGIIINIMIYFIYLYFVLNKYILNLNKY